jgi:microcystin-dependent protein
MTSIDRNYLTLTAHQKPTVGDMKTSAVNVDHIGWLKCDGRLFAVTDYYWLWQVIGYSFGGSGANFRIPNSSGRVPGFIGSNSGPNFGKDWALGDLSGNERHTLNIAEMPTHNHSNVTDLSGTGITNSNAGEHSHNGQTNEFCDTPESETVVATVAAVHTDASVSGSTQRQLTFTTSNAGIHTHGIFDPTHNHRIKNDGGSNAHNNMQPTIFVGNMFIYSGKATKVPNNNLGNYPYFVGGIF